MIVCFACEKPAKVHLFYEDGHALCRNCWSTKVLTCAETTVVERRDGSTRVLMRITRNRVPVVERFPKGVVQVEGDAA